MDDLLFGRCAIRPCSRGIFRDTSDCHIWNLHDRAWHHEVDFRDASLRPRDFWPHRVLRGRELTGDGSHFAHDRVAQLERTPRNLAHASLRPGTALPASRSAHSAPLRSVRVNAAVLSQTRATLRRDMNTANAPARRPRPAAVSSALSARVERPAQQMQSRQAREPRFGSIRTSPPGTGGPAHIASSPPARTQQHLAMPPAVNRSIAPGRTQQPLAMPPAVNRSIAPGRTQQPLAMPPRLNRGTASVTGTDRQRAIPYYGAGSPVRTAPRTFTAPRSAGTPSDYAFRSPRMMPHARPALTFPSPSYSTPPVSSFQYNRPSAPPPARFYGSPNVSAAPRAFARPSAPYAAPRSYSRPSMPSFSRPQPSMRLSAPSRSFGDFGGGGGHFGGRGRR